MDWLERLVAPNAVLGVGGLAASTWAQLSTVLEVVATMGSLAALLAAAIGWLGKKLDERDAKLEEGVTAVGEAVEKLTTKVDGLQLDTTRTLSGQEERIRSLEKDFDRRQQGAATQSG